MQRLNMQRLIMPNNYQKEIKNNKEELKKLLEEYKGILTSYIINYLDSLIELEFSVVRDYIKDEDKKVLSELEVYQKIATYNIYNRALNILNNSALQLRMTGYNCLSVSALLNDGYVSLFDFNYHKRFNIDIPKNYKNMEIGTISLYRVLENPEIREEELYRILNILEDLYNETNPYSLPYDNCYGSQASRWEYQHNEAIKKYENMFQELDNKKGLTEEEKQKIEVTNQICDLFLKDYGLTAKDFQEESINNKSKTNKELVKTIPNLTIVNHINYL